MTGEAKQSTIVVEATYTTVLDDWVHCISPCRVELPSLLVIDVEMAANADNPEVVNANSITDVYITLTDGTALRTADGLIDPFSDYFDFES